MRSTRRWRLIAGALAPKATPARPRGAGPRAAARSRARRVGSASAESVRSSRRDAALARRVIAPPSGSATRRSSDGPRDRSRDSCASPYSWSVGSVASVAPPARARAKWASTSSTRTWICACTAARSQRAHHAADVPLRGDHHDLVAEAELGVADAAVGHVHAEALLEAEGLVEELERGGRVGVDEHRREALHRRSSASGSATRWREPPAVALAVERLVGAVLPRRRSRGSRARSRCAPAARARAQCASTSST